MYNIRGIGFGSKLYILNVWNNDKYLKRKCRSSENCESRKLQYVFYPGLCLRVISLSLSPSPIPSLYIISINTQLVSKIIFIAIMLIIFWTLLSLLIWVNFFWIRFDKFCLIYHFLWFSYLFIWFLVLFFGHFSPFFNGILFWVLIILLSKSIIFSLI